VNCLGEKGREGGREGGVEEGEGGRKGSQAPPTTVQPGLGVAGGVDPHPIELRFWVLGVDGDEGEEEEEEGGDLRTTHFWSCEWWMRLGVREGREGSEGTEG